MSEISKLIEGYKNFYKHYFVDNDEVYKNLSKYGQFPIAAVIACSDSRADPALVTGAEPGELFVIRNVANLVPPYQDDNTTYHGTSAALEFGVNILKIKNVIVFGHSKCAGIRALVDSDNKGPSKSFVESWVKIASDVKQQIAAENKGMDKEAQAHICEKKAIEKSLQNLMTFPWISEKVEKGELKLHGWHFDIDLGALMDFDIHNKKWGQISDNFDVKKLSAK